MPKQVCIDLTPMSKLKLKLCEFDILNFFVVNTDCCVDTMNQDDP